jgi:hypothetical protein
MVQILYTNAGTAVAKESHPRQWVDGSDHFYKNNNPQVQESHPRQWVDGSDPFYKSAIVFMYSFNLNLNKLPAPHWLDFQSCSSWSL